MKDISDLTPMMRQYLDIKSNHPDHLLFYRLGDFYELFYEDARIAARELELVLTSRNAGNGAKADMCGVPYHAVEGYIGSLIEKGFSIAVCEQMEDPRLTKGLVKREVTKIITPGTLTESGLLDSTSNNYLLSMMTQPDRAAISYVDLSSFTIRLQMFEGPKAVIDALEEIRSLRPAEILRPEDDSIDLPFYQTGLADRYFDFSQADGLFHDVLQTRLHPEDLSDVARASLAGLIRYIQETQKIGLNARFELTIQISQDHLMLDHAAIVNLELFETLRTKERKGSLIDVIDRTVSPMGKRLIREWLRKPLRQKSTIDDRLHWVETFLKDDQLRDRIRHQLENMADIERIIGKLIYGSIQPKELLALKNSLLIIPSINQLLQSVDYSILPEFQDLTEQLTKLLRQELPATMKDGGFIRPEYHPELMEYVDIVEHGSDRLLALEIKERQTTGIKNLRIKYNRVFGYFLEVTNSYQHLVPSHYIRKQTLTGSERYFTEELKDLEDKILNARERQIELEKQLYQAFVTDLATRADGILRTGQRLAELDVLSSFATLAKQERYVRPELSQNGDLMIEDGRHPVVEQVIGPGQFVVNDCQMDETNRFFIITGPNMGGKSTYLRQVALISLMAHMGCFVPAAKAVIPLLDRIFTRVGASDDLTQGQSTFMVEMNELATILSQASDRSLVILDEIGRGTSTYDGLSIAWSVVEYLTKRTRPKTLFATHYHELTEIEDAISGVKNFRIAVRQMGDDLVLLRKIVPGRAHQSFGIQAAKLAGLPQQVIRRAGQILEQLEASDIVRSKQPVEPSQELIREILDIPIDQITPLESLNLLSSLIKKAKHAHHSKT